MVQKHEYILIRNQMHFLMYYKLVGKAAGPSQWQTCILGALKHEFLWGALYNLSRIRGPTV